MANKRMYDELLELITTDSASGKESAIANKLMEKLRALGFTVSIDCAGESFGGECGNVLGVLEGQLDGALLLCSHMDRVPNGLGIRPVERDGILYSDGTTILAADDVSGICAILEGVRRALEAGRPLPRLEVLFTVGEEKALHGAKAMDMSKLEANIGYMFDSPGHVGRIIHGAPGMYHLEGKITGRPAHAGNEPEKGIDAAKTMCDMLSTLKQGRLDEVSTANFPILSTGSNARNVVCDAASFKGEARSRDPQRLLDYVDYFKTHCRNAADAHGAKLELTTTEIFAPFLIPEEEPVLKIAQTACAKLELECQIDVGGGGMDANIFNSRGMTAVGVATGYFKNHTKEEHLVLEDFYKSGELAQALIETFADTCVPKKER